MADMGHTIVGVEISPVAIEQFFNENEIEYDVNPFELMKETVYTSINGSIRIYCGDFFLFGSSVERDFDGIWDRGSFNTLCDMTLKKKYIKILTLVMKPDCKIIMEFALMENTIEAKDMKDLFDIDYEVTEYDVNPFELMRETVYTSINGSIRIYCGDFFLFGPSVERDFDGIWDRGSFNTLCDITLKKKYIKILTLVMKPDCKIIMEFALMENTIEAKDMKELFDVDYEVTDLGVVSGYAPEYDDTQFQFFRICRSN
jgi:hypothetical protein